MWWHEPGIRRGRIDPGHPEQDGRHERMHLDLKRETASPPPTTFAKQQLRFDQFRARFNQERPHEALDQKPEAKRIKELEREVARKDKALAETAALLVLQNKLQLLFPEGQAAADDDTDDGSDK